MLAGERFTDRPRCVDPVLAAYLRAFNDRLGDRERQRLLPYAAAAVGTRTDRPSTRRRLDLCLEAAGLGGRRLLARARLALLVGVGAALRLREGAGEIAAREIVARGDVEEGFRLLDRLLASEAPPLALAGPGAAQLGGAAGADLVADPQRA